VPEPTAKPTRRSEFGRALLALSVWSILGLLSQTVGEWLSDSWQHQIALSVQMLILVIVGAIAARFILEGASLRRQVLLAYAGLALSRTMVLAMYDVANPTFRAVAGANPFAFVLAGVPGIGGPLIAAYGLLQVIIPLLVVALVDAFFRRRSARARQSGAGT
jgi:hypothetical protein